MGRKNGKIIERLPLDPLVFGGDRIERKRPGNWTWGAELKPATRIASHRIERIEAGADLEPPRTVRSSCAAQIEAPSPADGVFHAGPSIITLSALGIWIAYINRDQTSGCELERHRQRDPHDPSPECQWVRVLSFEVG